MPKVKPKPKAAGRETTFTATIPPTESAIKVHGENGARLLLDVAETDLGAFLMVLPMRGCQLQVTVKEMDPFA